MKLRGLTIAVDEMEKMVSFYNGVFASDLQPYEAFGTTLYRGKLGDLELLLCPNALLEIQAEKNRQQLSFWVDNLDLVLEHVIEHGGKQMQEIAEHKEGRACGVTDPDGNSIELVERSWPS